MELWWPAGFTFRGIPIYYNDRRPSNMLELKAGDELVVSMRRTHTNRDPAGGPDIVNVETKEISVVRCPDDGRVIVGGTCEDQWIDDKRYIVIKLETKK